jgi:hypothetical protein
VETTIDVRGNYGFEQRADCDPTGLGKARASDVLFRGFAVLAAPASYVISQLPHIVFSSLAGTLR